MAESDTPTAAADAPATPAPSTARAAQAFPRAQLLAAAATYSDDVGQPVTVPMVAGALAMLDASSDAPVAELSRKEMVAAVKAFLKRPDPTGSIPQEEVS